MKSNTEHLFFMLFSMRDVISSPVIVIVVSWFLVNSEVNTPKTNCCNWLDKHIFTLIKKTKNLCTDKDTVSDEDGWNLTS